MGRGGIETGWNSILVGLDCIGLGESGTTFDWVALGWMGMEQVGLDCIAWDGWDCNRLDWIGLGWMRLWNIMHCIELDGIGTGWIGIEWIALDWIELGWIGLEWSGVE